VLILALLTFSPRILGVFFANLGATQLSRAALLGGLAWSQQAERRFLQALQNSPQLGEAQLGLGLARLLQGKAQLAVQAFSLYLEQNPLDWRARLFLGDAYSQLGDHQRALTEWRVTTAESLLLWSGLAAEQTGDLESAIDWYHAASQVAPDWSAPFYYLGKSLRKEGQTAEALAALRQAAALTPSDPYIHHQLGLIYMSLGEPRQAIFEFEQTLLTLPNDYWTHMYLANLYLNQGEPLLATKAARGAVVLGDSPQSHYLLGRALMDLHSTDEAIVVLQEAVRMATEWKGQPTITSQVLADYYASLAKALCLTKQEAQAFQAYQQALELDQNQVEAKQALENQSCK